MILTVGEHFDAGQVHDLLERFLDTVNTRDRVALQRDWAMAPAVAEELYQDLDSYFPARPAITVAPRDLANKTVAGGRPMLDAFLRHDHMLVLECVLFGDGVPGEAILHVDIRHTAGVLSLHYRYTGS